MKLSKSFYVRDDVNFVAKSLLGKRLMSRTNGEIKSGIIVETEAYHEKERACHAFGGKKTPRTQTLFKEGGMAYIYLCYGVHHLFNVVTGPEGSGQAALIRGIEPDFELDSSIRPNGPGKLTNYLGIKTSMNECSLLESDIWIETVGPSTFEIVSTTRIGVDYAGDDAFLPWRYYIKNNLFVSKY